MTTATATATAASAAREQFVANAHSNPEMDDLTGQISAINRAITDTEAKIAKANKGRARSTKPSTIEYFNNLITDAQEAVRLWENQLVGLNSRRDALRNEWYAAKREVEIAATRAIMAEFGKVFTIDDSQPSALVTFVRDGTVRIYARGRYSFEVGILDDPAQQMGRAWRTVEVLGPDAGWADSHGVVRSRIAAKVNWGSFGASTAEEARQFATILMVAGDLANMVNRMLGLSGQEGR